MVFLSIRKSDSADDQTFLEKQIIRCNYRSFLQTVVLGSANYIPFLKLTTPQRREVIESLLDLKVFSSMQGNLKIRLSEICTQLSDSKRNSDLIESQIELILESNKSLQSSNDSVIAQKEKIKGEIFEAYKICRDTIEASETALGSLDYDQPVMDGLIAELKKHTTLLSDLKAKENALRHEIGFLQDHENCPTCKQPIDQTFRGLTVRQKMDKIGAIARRHF
jgi:hypothetical protein